MNCNGLKLGLMVNWLTNGSHLVFWAGTWKYFIWRGYSLKTQGVVVSVPEHKIIVIFWIPQLLLSFPEIIHF